MQDFRELQVWQQARRLTVLVYQSTSEFPVSEEFALKSQLRRASVSICANVAEGRGRYGEREFRQFLNVALGSATELECELLIAGDLGFLSVKSCESLIDRVSEIRRMLNALIKRLSAKSPIS